MRMYLQRRFRSTRISAVVALALVTVGCTTFSSNPTAVAVESSKVSVEDSGFPYHPFVYHLDLSILAYQLYGQSLIWPFDPYYEEHASDRNKRTEFMADVHRWSAKIGRTQTARANGIGAYRGPGVLLGLANNPSHDPILYDYSKIHPWSNTLTNASGTWTEYLTPKIITNQIKSVHVCSHRAGTAANQVSYEKVSNGHTGAAANAKDMLLAFEGGTGDKGEAGQPASQSLMGFVLVREKPAGDYDIHIAFRGSRSGSARRAIFQALSDGSAKGNPDWITDLGYNRLSSDQGTNTISTIGTVHRGFAQSMKSIHPNLFHCIDQVGRIKKQAAPTNIYVTGHSLGGGLAQTFVASVLMGDQYGPKGKGDRIPSSVRGWPWQQIKLISYSAPRVGDETFAEVLTEQHLQSEFFSTTLDPIDRNALTPADRFAVARIIDETRPVGYRVLHSKDPITTQRGAGGKHVGKTVYVNTPTLLDLVSLPDFNAHEQRTLRDLLLAKLSSSKIPKFGMRYRQMSDINPGRDDAKKGSVEELKKMASALKKYYSDNSIWFDTAVYDRNVATRLEIENHR